ncbi:ABC transporter ATP-binding protein [Clostridium cibarium]|uniref:ATP-binding cassette domain-containing protein n=1 Tax=Clostridium cibarium TaxID=2762247 RepID=A0ABR8PU14_9CLOT|nr:ATP-binding cassette domain-containing protein [Clostridium cibarium]MBD7911605.1 ATP-binding cassette domain-containing protein [Clostridium cibarium]
MEEIILRAIDLNKKYNQTKVLNNVNITIKKGRIYGFVGQNGAGKTTVMRIISGLSIADSGYIEMFGVSDRKGLIEERKRMGSMIETPAFYPYMTAYENIEAARIAYGIPSKDSSEKALVAVGLQDTGKKKVQDFSMGMKQRLGIAISILNEPEFLVLDEPTNGLDPISMIEIRDLIASLARDKNITILISSHILEQLYQLVTDYIIIHKGQILRTITKEELDKECEKHIAISVDNTSLAIASLEKSLNIKKYKIMPDDSILLYDYVDDVQKVINTLSKGEIIIKKINVNGDSLENYFINLIGGVENFKSI